MGGGEILADAIATWEDFSKQLAEATVELADASLIEQEDGDEREDWKPDWKPGDGAKKVKKAVENTIEKGKQVVDGVQTFVEKAREKVKKWQAKKEELQAKVEIALAQWEDAKAKGGKILADAIAAWEDFNKQLAEATAKLQEAKVELADASLIEQEDGDEQEDWKPGDGARKVIEKGKQVVDWGETFVEKAREKVKKWQAKKEEL